MVAGEKIYETNCNGILKNAKEKITEFDTIRKAIPHPGFLEQFAFCPKCGEQLVSTLLKLNL